MVMGSFCVSQRYELKDQVWRICRDLGKGILIAEELATGRMQEVKVIDLLTEWKSGRLILGGRPVDAETSRLNSAVHMAHIDAFRQSYSEKDQQIAKVKLTYVQALKQAPRSVRIMKPLIDEVWTKNTKAGVKYHTTPPHFTTVARWIRAYHDAGDDIRALVDKLYQKGNRRDRVHPMVTEMVDDLIHTRYLTPERPPIQEIRKEVKGWIALKNSTRLAHECLCAPSFEYIKRKIRELPAYDVCRARYGKRVADLKFRTAGSGVVTSLPLERAAMDHTRMDIFVIDEHTCLPLGRPWLTLIIDEHTRYVLGFYLSFEEPSKVSMARALRHALAPKDASQHVKASWDAWGAIETLVVDNGMEFHAHALEDGVGRFGGIVQFCPRRKPWYKGKIERFFGTLNTSLLVDMKGKTFSNVVLKGDYDPAKHAVVTLETLRHVVHIWIVDIYHQTRHSVLHMTPQQAWDAHIEQVDRYLPPSSIAVEAAFSTSYKRQLTHKGIEFDTLFYNSAQLGALRQRYGDVMNVEVRASDDDLGSIVVVGPDGKTLIDVPALDREYAKGLTRWQHRVCKRFRNRLQDDQAAEISLLDAKLRIRALIQEDMAGRSRKTTRNKQQRFMQSGGASPSVEIEPRVAVPPPSCMGVPECALGPSGSLTGNESVDADEIPVLGSRKRSVGGVH
ncbi:Mu transposase C-terminal domain-containing protein [Xanthomonas tesorieronis]|uniref:Mu transposase C-terminal domain-containing protein n=1 Tax=Xanthomonas tesorieronis TaxID=3160839 RepID=UPI00351111AE